MTKSAPATPSSVRSRTDTGRPIAILADLQGPETARWRLCQPRWAKNWSRARVSAWTCPPIPGDVNRVQLPHPEIFAALEPGASLLVNDGKIRLKVEDCGKDYANCTVTVGGHDFQPQGRERAGRGAARRRPVRQRTAVDLEFACEMGVDWLALSFVQRPEDVTRGPRPCPWPRLRSCPRSKSLPL